MENERFSHLYGEEEKANKTEAPADGGNDLMSVIMSRPKPVFDPGEGTSEIKKESEKPAEGQPAPTAEPTPPPTPSAPQPTAKELQNTARRSAEMWVATLTMATKNICSAISGQPSENYVPEKTDREEYTVVCANYFQEVGEIMSPKTLFLISSLAFFGAMIAKSLGDRRKVATQKAAAEKYKKANESYKKAVDSGDSEEIEEAVNNLKEVRSEAKRNHFQIDSKNFYTHDLNNNHIKGPKPELCTDQRIIDIVEKHRRGKTSERLRWGEINKMVRKMLYGHEDPVRNE